MSPGATWVIFPFSLRSPIPLLVVQPPVIQHERAASTSTLTKASRLIRYLLPYLSLTRLHTHLLIDRTTSCHTARANRINIDPHKGHSTDSLLATVPVTDATTPFPPLSAAIPTEPRTALCQHRLPT
jgi:hypothetical protein